MEQKKRSNNTHIVKIASSASFSPEKNTLVWKDKNGFIKKKHGFITFLLLTNNITPNDGSYMVIESS